MFQEPTHKSIPVLLAPNSMKGSLDAFRFAEIIEQAFQSVSSRFEMIRMPIADGGDFTAEVLIRALFLNRVKVNVSDPIGRIIYAEYGLRNELAVIEMANASGMNLLLSKELNPLKATTFGTGEMILEAIHSGAKTILLGVGGSATIDGGMGLLEGMGVNFYDDSGTKLRASGATLGQIHHWDESALAIMCNVEIKVIVDVTNPLLGALGAVAVFGKQKGASSKTEALLEHNLEHFSQLIVEHKRLDLAYRQGMGAAGGVCLALCGFLNAELVLGADFILDAIGFNKVLKNACLLVTGEGQIDEQTVNNKAPFVAAKRAKQKGIPVYAIAGNITGKSEVLFDKVYSLMNDQIDRISAIDQVEDLVFECSKQAAQDFLKDL